MKVGKKIDLDGGQLGNTCEVRLEQDGEEIKLPAITDLSFHINAMDLLPRAVLTVVVNEVDIEAEGCEVAVEAA